MSDITRMHGEFDKPVVDGDMVMLTGSGPVSEMLEYGMEVVHYTKGQGSFYTKPKGYYPCHNTQEVIDRIGYDKDADLENTSSSVFCSHGSGFVVKWDEVKRYMHVEQNL